MKLLQGTKSTKIEVKIDPSLEKYRDIILFPEKLAKANKILKTARIPKNMHHI